MNSVRNIKTKLLALTAIILLAVCLSPAMADTFFVDNNPLHQADYTTLQEAVDAASAGDTIMVGPSFNGLSYGDALIEKQLFIYGTGYLLAENSYDATVEVSRIGTITITPKIVSNSILSNPNGTVISGLYINDNYSGQSVGVSGSGLANGTVNNVLITRNLLIGTLRTFPYSSIIVSRNYCLWEIELLNESSATIQNNIIKYGIRVSDNNHAVVINNSFDASATIEFREGSTGLASNNITTNPIIDGNGGSGEVVIQGNLLVTTAELLTATYIWEDDGTEGDARYQLRTGSMAIGACSEGADCGAFGTGPSPYILSGLPPRPRITGFSVSDALLQSDSTMTVTVSAEGRN